MKLRRRLIVLVTAVTMFVLAGAFLAVFQAVYRNQQHQLDVALLNEAHEEALEAASLGGDKLAIIKGPGPLANDIGPLTKYGALYDFKGHAITVTDTFGDRPPKLNDIRHELDECFDTQFRGERLRAVLVGVPAHDGVMLLLAAPRLDLERDATFLRHAMSGVFVVGVVWAALVASWIVRRLTRGHEAIASVARRVADGDLTARVDASVIRGDPQQLAQDINEMIDRLSTLLTSQQDFIVHAAHELRSPLTLLYGELALAVRRSRDADDYRRSINEALEAASALKTLAEDLLVLARIGATPEQPAERVEVGEIVRRVVAALDSEVVARSLAVRVDGSCRAGRGRSRDIERVFRNIVENAIRHSPDRGTIEIRCNDGDDGRVMVTITDEGNGIADADRDRIFQPFYRGPDDISDLPGFGMGLAIARKIARACGGDVRLAARQTRGAEFVITLRADSAAA